MRADEPRGAAKPRKAKARQQGAPKYKPVPTPDQAQGRPSEPVKVVVRQPTGKPRPDGTRAVKRTVHTLPDSAHAQAHLDRLEQARKARARARGQQGPTGRSARPKVVIVPKAGESFEHAQKGAAGEQAKYERRVARADAVTRVRVRALARAQRTADERDIGLAGAARSSERGKRQFAAGVEREARKHAPEIVDKTAKGPERTEFSGAVVKGVKNGKLAPDYRAAVDREATKRQKARKAAEPKPGDVLGNAKRELKDTLTSLPTTAAELANVAAEQIGIDETHGVKQTHTKALVKGLKERTVPGKLLQGDLKGAAKLAATQPIGTALTAAGGAGAAAKGASVAGDAARAVKAGAKVAEVPVKVRVAQATRRARPNVRVEKKQRTGDRARTERQRQEAQRGEYRQGELGTRAQSYSANPIVRAGQKAGENRRAGKGQDPFAARGRKAKRIVKADAKRRVDQQQAAGHVRSAEVAAAVDDTLAAAHGPRAAVARRKARRTEKRALRARRKGEKEIRRHAFALAQSGIVDTSDAAAIARTLEQHAQAHRDSLAKDKHTPESRASTQKNLARVEEMKRRHDRGDSPFDDDLIQAAEQRRRVGEGQDRRRAKRLKGGEARAKGRVAKAIRLGRSDTPGPEPKGAAATPSRPDVPGGASRSEDPDVSGAGSATGPAGVKFEGLPTPEIEKHLAGLQHKHKAESDKLANLPVERRAAVKKARSDAERKQIIDRFEKRRYAIQQTIDRVDGKIKEREAQLRERHDYLKKNGEVERTAHAIRSDNAQHPDTPVIGKLTREKHKQARRIELGKQRDNILNEIQRVHGAHERRRNDDPISEHRAEYKRTYGIDMPATTVDRNHEIQRLIGEDVARPDKRLQGRIRALRAANAAADKHHGMQRRRMGRIGHRQRELEQVEQELGRLDAELGKRTPEDTERELAAAHERRNASAAPEPVKEQVPVRQVQAKHIRDEIADEHAGEAMHGDRARPTSEVEKDLAAASGRAVRHSASRTNFVPGKKFGDPGTRHLSKAQDVDRGDPLWGRGMVHKDGRVDTWFEQEFSHDEMADDIVRGIQREDGWEQFGVRPDGTIAARGLTPRQIEQVLVSDPRLKPPPGYVAPARVTARPAAPPKGEAAKATSTPRAGAPAQPGPDDGGTSAPRRGSSSSAKNEGGYVPVDRELDGTPDARLGAHDIDGLLTRESLLSNDWGKYDPRDTQGRLERGINADALRREVLAQAHDGKTNLSAENARSLAKRLSSEGVVKWARVATKDGDDTYAVIPKVLADRWRAASRQKRLPGRVLDTINQRFVRAVLPLSAMWHVGNAVDMMTRLALSGARPGDAQLAHQLRRVVGDHDQEWARLAIDSVGGAHFRGQSMIKAVGRHIPLLDDALDQLFAAGRAVEAKAARSAQGTALRAQAKAIGLEARDVQRLVKEWRKRPELVEDFQQRTLRILGDYVHHPLVGSHDLRAIAPFIQWIKASLKFTFHTLPKEHPIRTALLFNLAAATEEQRRLIGASQYITEQQAQDMGLPRPRSGFLAGGLSTASGVMPTSGLTSLSAAGGLVDDPVDYMGRILVPWADRPVARVLGTRDGAQEYGMRTARKLAEGQPLAKAIKPGSGRDTGDPFSKRAFAEAASAGFDAFAPGFSEAGKVARGGRRPGVHTTSIQSLRFGDSQDKDGKYKDGSSGKTYTAVAVLAGATPQRDFPVPESKRPVETSGAGRFVKVKDLQGKTYTFDTLKNRVVPKAKARPKAGARSGNATP